MGARVLLIGGAGFLGSYLVDELLANGSRVAVLDRSGELFRQPMAGVEAFKGEVRDLPLLRSALRKYPTVIFLAHEAHGVPTADCLPANFLSNIELFLLVLAQAVECHVSNFLLFSSGGAVYGECADLPIAEDHPLEPCSAYGVAKLTMEKYLAVSSRQHGFRSLIIRPSNPYGPRQNFRGVQGVVAVAMARMARGQTLVVRGDGSTLKDYLFASDLAASMIRLLNDRHISGVFNVGSGQGIPLMNLLGKIEGVVGRKAHLVFEEKQRGDVQANVLDISKIGAATRWSPSVSLEEGLKRTWDWMHPLL